MTFKELLRFALGIATTALIGDNAFAAQTNVAVAANFTDAAKEIATGVQTEDRP